MASTGVEVVSQGVERTAFSTLGTTLQAVCPAGTVGMAPAAPTIRAVPFSGRRRRIFARSISPPVETCAVVVKDHAYGSGPS